MLTEGFDEFIEAERVKNCVKRWNYNGCSGNSDSGNACHSAGDSLEDLPIEAKCRHSFRTIHPLVGFEQPMLASPGEGTSYNGTNDTYSLHLQTKDKIFRFFLLALVNFAFSFTLKKMEN